MPSRTKNFKQNKLAAIIECFSTGLIDLMDFNPPYRGNLREIKDLHEVWYANDPRGAQWKANIPYLEFTNTANGLTPMTLTDLLMDPLDAAFSDEFFVYLGRCIALGWFLEDVDATRDNLLVLFNEEDGSCNTCYRFDFDCAFASLQQPNLLAKKEKIKRLDPTENNPQRIINHYWKIMTDDEGLTDEGKQKLEQLKASFTAKLSFVQQGFLRQSEKIVRNSQQANFKKLLNDRLGLEDAAKPLEARTKAPLLNAHEKQQFKSAIEQRLLIATQMLVYEIELPSSSVRHEIVSQQPAVMSLPRELELPLLAVQRNSSQLDNAIQKLNAYRANRNAPERAHYESSWGFLACCIPFYFQGYSKTEKVNQASLFVIALMTKTNLNEFIKNSQYKALREGKLGGIFKKIIRDLKKDGIIDKSGNFTLHW